MGVIATARVLTRSDRRGRPVLMQPGNREWVTVIESINCQGWALPAKVIFAGKLHQASWYESVVPDDWHIGVSEKGWTSDDLGLQWLKEVFDPSTRRRTVGTHRLLILDGHGSHVAPEFDQYCTANSIVVVQMPAHSSHLLQPLDVGCFSPLKTIYGRKVQEKNAGRCQPHRQTRVPSPVLGSSPTGTLVLEYPKWIYGDRPFPIQSKSGFN